VCFETLGSKIAEGFFATLKGLRGFGVNRRLRNSFRVAPSRNEMRFPGLPKRNPGLELANAFSVIHILISLVKTGWHFDFLCKAVLSDLTFRAADSVI
jgi:hypothetical protein